jgi:hypothetical protein
MGGLRGLSTETEQKLKQYEAGYTQSAAVTNAYNYLQNVQNNKPGEFTSNYTNQLNNLYDQIINRKDFQYDLNSDTLYKQAKEQYVNLGKQAMMDTMGQAANLTGGYGNSYASTAGNQAYQSYLQKLNDNIPDYYNLALQKYNTEGENLYNKFSTTQGLYNQDYAQYRDKVSDYYQDYSNAYTAYSDERNFDYNKYSTEWKNWLDKASAENGDYWTEQEYLEAQRQFEAEMAEKQRQFDANLAEQQRQYNASLAASSSRSGGGSSKSYDYSKLINEIQNMTSGVKTYDANGVTSANNKIRTYLNTLVNEGYISESTATDIYGAYSLTYKSLSSGRNSHGGGGRNF